MALLENKIREDLLITALEGGSNYWYQLGDLEEIKKKYKEKSIQRDSVYGDCLSMILFTALLSGEEIPVYDAEEFNHDKLDTDQKSLGIISKKSISRGENKMLKDEKCGRRIVGNILKDNWDAGDADAWFQFAVMGECIYG